MVDPASGNARDRGAGRRLVGLGSFPQQHQTVFGRQRDRGDEAAVVDVGGLRALDLAEGPSQVDDRGAVARVDQGDASFEVAAVHVTVALLQLDAVEPDGAHTVAQGELQHGRGVGARTGQRHFERAPLRRQRDLVVVHVTRVGAGRPLHLGLHAHGPVRARPEGQGVVRPGRHGDARPEELDAVHRA